ncbi:hypothetical protein BHC44_01305 [Snodgrassella alvi]|nr:hypothetical protein BHC44_01305 [Snodgrassella alvi]
MFAELRFKISASGRNHQKALVPTKIHIAQFHPSFKPKSNYISAPFFKGEYLFPQAFVDYPDIKVIYQVDNLIM